MHPNISVCFSFPIKQALHPTTHTPSREACHPIVGRVLPLLEASLQKVDTVRDISIPTSQCVNSEQRINARAIDTTSPPRPAPDTHTHTHTHTHTCLKGAIGLYLSGAGGNPCGGSGLCGTGVGVVADDPGADKVE